MAGIDLDEHMRHIIESASDGVRETKKRREHRLGIDARRKCQPGELAHSMTFRAILVDDLAVRALSEQARRTVQAQCQRTDRGSTPCGQECNLLIRAFARLFSDCFGIRYLVAAPCITFAHELGCRIDLFGRFRNDQAQPGIRAQ